MNRESMVFYESFYKAIKKLPPEQFKDCMQAVLEYAFYGKEVDDDGVSYVFFSMAKPQIDANNRKFENGKKGGRPQTIKKPTENHIETKQKPKENQKEPSPENQKPNVNVNVNENVNVNVKEKESLKEKDSELPNVVEMPPRQLLREMRPLNAPQLVDVQEFCALKNLQINPEAFFRRYEAMNWKIGGTPIHDWRELAMSWNADQRNHVRTGNPNAQTTTGSKVMDAMMELRRNGDF